MALHDLNDVDIDDNMWDLIAPNTEHTEIAFMIIPKAGQSFPTFVTICHCT